VSILLGWSQSADAALSLAALEQLAALTNRPAEAAMAADRLADVRERTAMEAIVELGGRVEYDRQVPVFTGTTPTLQVVIGPKWTGGVEGLDHLSAVRRATTVSFYSASVGGDEAAVEISKLTQMQRVEFYGTKISSEALAKLRETLPPGTVIDVRGGARLGIAGQPVGVGGAGVGAVDPGTAAEKAGLMPGDIITEIEGVAVADFEALTKEIAKCEAGDSITLKVLRPSPTGQPMGSPMTLTVTFARWGDEEAVNPTAPSPLGGTPLGMPTRVLINRR
jgi:membrane-associated protease RseP (regulator of RpoE activity)